MEAGDHLFEPPKKQSKSNERTSANASAAMSGLRARIFRFADKTNAKAVVAERAILEAARVCVSFVRHSLAASLLSLSLSCARVGAYMLSSSLTRRP